LGYLVLNIHDEVVCEVKEDVAESAALAIKKIMADSLGWFLEDLKGEAEVNISRCWQK
jgi:DNA polymerase I-like protein with 3'-5' exonuclease and polymerase domains